MDDKRGTHPVCEMGKWLVVLNKHRASDERSSNLAGICKVREFYNFGKPYV